MATRVYPRFPIYAKETLPTATAQGSAGNFHAIDHGLAVAGPAGIGSSANDRLFVSYVLEGMVFRTPVTGGVSGGAVGGTNVTFRIATETASTAAISHTFELAVSASGGSITRTVTNESLPSNIPRTESLTARIMVSSALKETVVESNPVTARAAHDFMAFGGTATNPDLKAKLGSLQVGVQTGTVGVAADPSANPPVAAKADTRYRNAASDSAKGGTTATGSADTNGTDANGIVDQLAEIMQLGTTAATMSTATVAGDVSFVKRIGFTDATDSATDDCPSATSDIRKPATAPATGYTDEFTSQSVSTFATAQYLCLEADGETPISAGAYTVTTKYAKRTASAFGPEGGTHTLGSIRRDGTTVHIPYLSVAEQYNHRIILRNRSGQPTMYNITFAPEMGATATAGDAASGMVMAGETKIIRAADIVTIEGKSRTAATVTAPIDSAHFDVSTTLVNKSDGSTDTETYAAQ